MGLLVPILNGFLQKSFAFIFSVPVLGPVMGTLPPAVIENDRLVFAVLLCGFIAAYILKNVLRFLSVISMGYFSERAVHHLRKTLFTKYLSFGKLFFDTSSVGHHSALLLDFSQQAFLPIAHIDKFMNALFALTVYTIVLILISWKLTLIAIPLFIVLHFIIRSIILRIKHLSHFIAKQGADLNKRSVEILSTIPLVKAYQTERYEQQRYADISDKKSRLGFRLNVLNAVMLPMQEIITVLTAATIFMGALYLLGRDQIASAPALLVYFYIVINATSKFGTLSGFRGTLAAATGPLDAVIGIFEDDGKHVVKGGKEVFSGLREGIRCKKLTFSYGDRDVIRNVSFDIPKGQMTAIVGPTGSGKSTLINLLMRYYECPPETIFVDGKDIRGFSLDSYLSHVAIVSQETLLLHDSLRNNITYGLEHVSEKDLKEAVERARLSQYVQQLPMGLETLIGDRGVKLSGGEKQRVSIARALLKKADILILDEATSSLDSQTEKLIQEAVDEAVQGRTSIVIAHRLSTIKHADKIVVLKDGEIAEEGKLEELLEKKGVFSGLWNEQKF